MVDIGEIIDVAENEQLRSIPAQRLIEKLSLLKNRVEPARKRWFWELLQNASDYNEKVNICLQVTDDEVIFKHDGGPFSIIDALNIISPDSNKQDDTVHNDNIGKFGTGLVSTHILSSVMDIKGVCLDKDAGCYKFSMSLDRSSFLNKTALITQITDAKNAFKASLEPTDATGGFNTSFSYPLGKPLPTVPAMKAEDIDLDYLYKSLPYTLCFMHKVESVRISDNRSCSLIKDFRIARKAKTPNKIAFDVEKDSVASTLEFAYFERTGISSVFQIEGGSIMPFPAGLSRIFCGLPLIGTENTGLPFILNSLKFEPTTEREGVELEPSSNEANRKLFFESINLYCDILDYVAKEKLNGAYNLTKLAKKYNGTQTSQTQFSNIFLSKYKQHVLSHAIVKNAAGDFISFSSVKLPFKDSKKDGKLYDNALLLNESSLPQNDDYESWFNSTDFTIFPDQKYTSDNLAKEIEQKGSIYSFGKGLDEVVTWLVRCSEYFKECDKYIFSRYKLLPNQNGTFCYSDNKLYAESSLPPELKKIYDKLYERKDKKVEDFLLDIRFNDLDLTNQKYSVDMLAKDIDEELSNQYSENQGNTTSISGPLNELYTWITGSDISKANLEAWFHWYYPKRASLIVDLLTEKQREQALVIAQSGKMEALATLAEADLDEEDIKLLVANIKKLPAALSMLNSTVDDREFADSNEGDKGEEIVFKDLLQKYPSSQGYKVIWAARERQEPCYDFEILKNGQPFCYCDAKTTRRGIANADSIPFFMRMSQWNFLKTLDDSLPYFIARVFMQDGGAIRYMRISRVQ